MTENYKIVSEFIKDMSSETPDIETYLFVKENITKYHLAINITSKALKNKMIEVCTTLKYEDKEASEKRSYFEINYATIVKLNEEVVDKKKLERAIETTNFKLESLEFFELSFSSKSNFITDALFSSFSFDLITILTLWG